MFGVAPSPSVAGFVRFFAWRSEIRILGCPCCSDPPIWRAFPAAVGCSLPLSRCLVRRYARTHATLPLALSQPRKIRLGSAAKYLSSARASFFGAGGMSVPSARQWRSAAAALRDHAERFEATAAEIEASGPKPVIVVTTAAEAAVRAQGKRLVIDADEQGIRFDTEEFDTLEPAR